MAASKRLSELVLQALATSAPAVHGSQGTCFSMVRFGNVLGSSGSVVPLFREQIKKGGPITLTHPDINRFFMTIPEAAQLVVQAGDIAIEITGLRPGEKLYEELLIGDNPQPTQHPRIMKAHEDYLPWGDLEAQLTELQAALHHNDVAAMKQQLATLVHGYQPADGVVD